jgi:RND family efflux transporter MFP subunit
LQTLHNLPPQAAEEVKKQIKVIPLISPINGTVLEVLRHTGDVVRKGDQIVHIGNLSVLDIRGDLPVRYLPALRKTKKLRVRFVDYPHDSLLLPVEAISGKVDKVTQTAMVRLKLQNPKREFYPGMAVELSFVDRIHQNAIVVPRAALLEKEGIFSVFVLKGKQVVKRIIQPGIMQKQYIEVVSGLKAGEQVAVKRAYSLTDGMEVVVK